MPRKRNPENRGLPPRWRKRKSGYYYQVPVGLEDKWDGKQTFKLGSTLKDASAEWARRVEPVKACRTVGDLLDRYEQEIMPTKALAAQKREVVCLKSVRSAFGRMDLMDVKPRHIYAHADKRKASIKKTSGIATSRLEIALLSHAYTKAVEWGYIDRHPFKKEVRLESSKPRDRYVEDWEIAECLAMPSPQKKGGVKVIQAYVRIKLLTALRQRDMLSIKIADMKADGIHIKISKTGKLVIVAWTEQLRQEINEAIKLRPVDISPYLFCTREGNGFVGADGQATGWLSMWQRYMGRLLKETKIKTRFTEHDLRAKAASDSETLERAKELLAHTNVATTQRIYRRKPEIIRPAK